ncbi:hypothetical protein ACFLQK_00355 [bacterium]
MNDKIFFQTIQYLDSLHDEGLLSREKTLKLARFSLELSKLRTPGKHLQNPPHSNKFSSSDNTSDILSDVLSDEWS